jgi:hypothetical protein
MGSQDPERAIREYLAADSVLIASEPVAGSVGWRSETLTGGLDAKPETITFVKVRAIPGRQVHAVSFETLSGQRMRFFCAIQQDDGGAWHVVAGAGGSADGSPQRDVPWVNLGGGWRPMCFYAGGVVFASGRDVVRVRLRAANGTELEDSAEGGVVLVVTDREVRTPIEVELLDRGGNVVGRHAALS